MSNQNLFNPFEKPAVRRYKTPSFLEIRERHSQTVYHGSRQPANRYSTPNWEEVTQHGDELYKKLASLMDKPAHSREVQVAIGEWRAHLTNYYYPCTLEIFRGLGDIYVEDKRFMANIDKYGSGLAKFMRKAMVIYCRQAR